MKIWKNTRLDAAMLVLSIAQFVATLLLATNWKHFSVFGWVGSFVLLVFMTVYNIIVVSHLFTHVHWFESPLLNGLVSMLNSINIGQSVQSYQCHSARSYHGGVAVSQEEREKVVDRGIAAFEKALALDPNYFDALSYINLTYREKAKALAAVGKIDEANLAYQKAEEYKKKATDLRAGQSAKKAG